MSRFPQSRQLEILRQEYAALREALELARIEQSKALRDAAEAALRVTQVELAKPYAYECRAVGAALHAHQVELAKSPVTQSARTRPA